jgi:uncharacterized protein
MSASRQFAIVTGASTGIGLELAKCCAQNNFDLLIAADEPRIEAAAAEIRTLGAAVETIEADLSTIAGVDKVGNDMRRRNAGTSEKDDAATVAGRGAGEAAPATGRAGISEAIAVT